MVIDFHTHCFPPSIAERAVDALARSGSIKPCSDGTEAALLRSMASAGIDRSVILPVHTRPEQSEKLNKALIRQISEAPDPRLIRFGGMHPDCERFRPLLRELAACGVRGIKLHPAFQKTDLDDIRMLRIIDAASEAGMIVVVHTGLDISFPEHNYATVSMVARVVRELAPPRLVAAHMGGWNAWDEVRADLAGAPLWLDTAFSLGPAEARNSTVSQPLHRCENLSAGAFAELARAHGIQHILFGTDSPWAEQKAYVDRIAELPLTHAEQEAILGKNAARLLEESGSQCR